MLDPLTIIPGKKRHTHSGWWVFNGICCHHFGHNPDKRSRAGVIFGDEDNWSYSCFNCGFKTGYQLGKHFSGNLKLLLGWCGIDQHEIERLSFKSFSSRNDVDIYIQKKKELLPTFNQVELPIGSRPLDPSIDGLHVEYLSLRGLTPDSYTFYVVDGEKRTRLIIPYYYGGKIVGHTSRYYDGQNPKYVSMGQRGYIFNIDKQKSNWEFCILVEGQFDAISIDGCAFMGNSINDDQAALIKTLNRKIIFVPDRDNTGLNVCSRAIDLGFHVSIPTWSDDIKDVNDAVVKYGKLPTLLSVLQNATASKIIVEMKRKKLSK